MNFSNNGGYGSPRGGNNNNFRHPSNDGFRAPDPPFASTPVVARGQRPRFAYSGPPNYPRPGSSAAKPNPNRSFSDLMRSRYVPDDNTSDSMINNYGDSGQYMDMSFQPNNSFASDYSSHDNSMSPDSSVYYSANESFGTSPQKNYPLMGQPYRPQQPNFRGNFHQSTPVRGQAPFKNFKASSVRRFQKNKPYTKPQVPGVKSDWRCDLCDINFTSRIPYAMHFQGQKHAKKLKIKEALKSIQSQVKEKKEVVATGSLFRCDICGIVANSTFQLQNHLDGKLHKTKAAAFEQEAEEKKNPNGKSDGEGLDKPDANPGEKSVPEAKGPKGSGPKRKLPKEKNPAISAVPSTLNSEDVQNLPKPPLASASKSPFSCEICDLTLNGQLQYNQHISGKYHKARVEGKPLPWKKNKAEKALEPENKLKESAEGTSEVTDTANTEKGTSEQMETSVTVEKPMDVVDPSTSEPMNDLESSIGTPKVARIVHQLEQNTKPLVGILKNKRASSGSAKVMGVKTITQSFVKGPTME